VRVRPFVAVALFAVALLACTSQGAGSVQAGSGFAGAVAELSEPGGYFDTDNLISNEASYLHVVGALQDPALHGGAYVGVGPDQNFSYIAHLRPSRAFIVDIRRDNMLLHLLFKSLFALSADRRDYLHLLFGRPPHTSPPPTAGLAAMLDALESIPPTNASTARARHATDSVISGFGVPLSDEDRATIDGFHRTFIAAGPALRFRSFGRAPRAGYPTYRELLLERDQDGRLASYLATDDAFRVVQELQARNRIIPVVGDLAGPHAMRAIGRYLEERRERVTAFYTSNVEYYLFRDGRFPQFVENVAALPHHPRALVLRSVFRTRYGPHPSTVPGYYSTQLAQPVAALSAGGIGSYWELVTTDARE
jgi:hypothetical protein